MIDSHFTSRLVHALRDEEEEREKAIQLSREIIRESKLIIYALQRGEKRELKKIHGLVKRLRRTSQTGIEETALQEYVEAVCFAQFLQHKTLPTAHELKVDVHAYLMGLADLTGELLRKAVKDVIEKRYESAREITAFVEEIYGLFLQFDLRNGALRQKADGIKWNVQKLEHLMLDISRD